MLVQCPVISQYSRKPSMGPTNGVGPTVGGSLSIAKNVEIGAPVSRQTTWHQATKRASEGNRLGKGRRGCPGGKLFTWPLALFPHWQIAMVIGALSSRMNAGPARTRRKGKGITQLNSIQLNPAQSRIKTTRRTLNFLHATELGKPINGLVIAQFKQHIALVSFRVLP